MSVLVVFCGVSADQTDGIHWSRETLFNFDQHVDILLEAHQLRNVSEASIHWRTNISASKR
jgi:hypothetical protein